MTTLILIALILLLICTAAGLIFLAVTISDRADENIIKNADISGGGDDYTGTRIVLHKGRAFTSRPGARVGRFSKKSGVELWGKNMRIVSVELKRDFENTLAGMKHEEEEVIPPPPPIITEPPVIEEIEISEPAAADSEEYIYEDYDDDNDDGGDTEFIDVFDLVNAGGAKSKKDEGFLDDDDEFLYSEEILG